MFPLRSVFWLLALLAFAVPPLGTAAEGGASVTTAGQAATDCPEHVPPPDPCPAKDTAKHAAGVCCPLISLVPGLLPAAPDDDRQLPLLAPVALPAPNLIGHILTKDPPPPRG
jgi:hypothetical protein